MKLKRTVIIEFERVRITTTPYSAKNFFRCELCGANAEFFSRAEASELIKTMRMQGLNVNQSNLHFYKASADRILICLNSIINGNDSVINKLISKEMQ